MKRLLLALASLLLLASCEQEVKVAVSTDITSYVFDRYGGEVKVVVFSNSDWTATCDVEGVTVTPSRGHCGGLVTVTVPENTDIATKLVRVKFLAEYDKSSNVAYVNITQGAVPFVSCQEDAVTVGLEGGTARFHVNSSDPWHIGGVTLTTAAGQAELEMSCWPLIDPAGWERNNVEVEVKVPASEDGLPRRWSVMLQLDSFPGEAPAYLVVEQK